MFFRYSVLARRSVLWWVLIAAAFTGSASARETVLWAALDFPPFQVLEGEYAGSGSFDGLLDLLVEHLDEYQHDIVPMTFARREEEIRQGTPLCTPGLFRTAEREEYLNFSLPALIHLSNYLVFRSVDAKNFGDDAAIDLESLLKRDSLVGGIIRGRSYAPNIDRLLRQYGKARHMVARPLKSFQMFDLLIGGEIDYTIMFPHEVAYLQRRRSLGSGIAMRPIADTPPYIFTHVACTKGRQGKAVIARVDQIIRERGATPEYRAFSERWYATPDKLMIRRHYPKLLDKHLEAP